MGRLMLLRKFSLLLLLLSASLQSTCLAGRYSKVAVKLDEDEETVVSTEPTVSVKPVEDEEEVPLIHERLLGMNTKDYGRYDPTPPLVKPPFKLIPN